MLSLAAVLIFLSASLAEQQPDVFTICGKLSSSQCRVLKRRFVSSTPVAVKYYLHTRQNKETPIVLEGKNPDLSGTPFRSNRPTKFIIHGFNSQGDVQWIVDIANELLIAEDLNVFGVDWQKGASPLGGINYFKAKKNCRKVGQTVGNFVRQLGQPGSMIHIIGHSLGAHAAGFAGKTTQSAGFTIARISGLDPAGPLFKISRPTKRLDKGDATFVDVIHTDAHWYGKRKPLGHVDFYPNEGWNQPGCGDFPVDQLTACSHGRAYEFYNESINSACQFLAYRCPDWYTFIVNREQCDYCDHSGLNGACSVMGYHSINYPDSQGSMYLVTKHLPPPHCVSETSRQQSTTQCLQSLGPDMRQQIWDHVDSIADMKEMGNLEDFCSLYSEMGTVVLNITAPMPNCGPEDIPVILEYIGDGKYDSVVAWAEDDCTGSSNGAFTLPSAMLLIALQVLVAVLGNA
ncbi:pancreatic triacylglycerol lipase-like [Branchiostoma floridae x Branchiostoma belcheri]